MKDKIILLCFMCLCFAGSANSQQVDGKQKWKFVVVPAEQVLVTVAAQPLCPIQFENIKYLAGVDGGRSPSFTVRNKGNKPIRAITVGGSDWTLEWSEKFTHTLLMPGGEAFSEKEEDDVEIVPLSDELRNKLQLKGSMRSVLVLMVIRVEYADGSVYDAEPTYKALQKYTEMLTDIMANAKPQQQNQP